MTSKIVNDPDDIMRSADECAAWLKVHRVTVWAWVKDGMPCIVLHNGRRWYSKTAISFWIAENSKAAQPK